MATAVALYAKDWAPFAMTLLILAAVAGALWVVALAWTTWIMHRPPRMTAGRALARLGRASPSDVGLNQYDEVVFNVPDVVKPGRNTTLAAWWIPHPAGTAVRRTCVMLHGYGDSRAGSLAWAELWQELGFHLLLLDLRAHGDSGGRLSGGGVWERTDLHAVIDSLCDRYPSAARQVVLFGVSCGGMIAAACAAERDVAALVVDSPVEGWGSATRRYAELLGLPLQRAHHLRLRLAERLLKVHFDDVRPAVTLPEVACPILAILPEIDVLVSPEESAAMARAVEQKGAPSRVWRPAASHNLAITSEPAQYGRMLRAFLENALAGG